MYHYVKSVRKNSQRIVNVLINRMSGKQEILVLGDSHTKVFNHQHFKEKFPDLFFHVVAVSGATASGLENPNSKTQAYQIFNRAAKFSQANQAIVLLGEVDAGFVIWYRAQKYNQGVDVMFTKTLDTYQKFVKEIARKYRVIVISTPLPTIEDGASWGEVANERKSVTATQKERTELTLAFNNKMSQFCKENDFQYIHLDKECLDDNGLVKRLLLNTDKQDHHYDQSAYARILADKLQQLT